MRALVETELVRAWPHIESAANERTFVKQGVGHGRFQPRMRTAVPNLVLCGSVHDMEKAVVTGMRAANCLLEERGHAAFSIRPLGAATARHETVTPVTDATDGARRVNRIRFPSVATRVAMACRRS